MQIQEKERAAEESSKASSKASTQKASKNGDEERNGVIISGSLKDIIAEKHKKEQEEN